MTDIETFELAGPLPQSRLAIEASAGTGKTFTLSTLAARYVAEDGVPISELLVVTFTRAAAAELKDRVRARLIEFAEALDTASRPDDALLALIWSEDREVRLERVRTAITEFDAATITTIHGFAQQVIGTLGSTVLTDPDAVLVDDTEAIGRQVATDVLVAEAVHEANPASEMPSLDDLRHSSQLALNNADSALVPGPDPDESNPRAARLRVLVDEITTEVDRRRKEAGTLSFDDLLSRLREALDDDLAGRSAGRHSGSATGSPSSTSFRTPIPSNGRSSTASSARAFGGPLPLRGTALRLPRWCWWATPSRPSTPSEAPTFTPISRPPMPPALA
ncbi:MAG: UvrD-helicase domain-containing protein [Candidatus Microthrix sp.]|nr:UvrD-helicase domain-containing protein [Candidatus Microthrix sp.]MBK7322584.1 UvrD-helicase domain-containing protein [Candidatus Microthrix sp.]